MRECVIGVDKYMYAMYVYWGITGVPRVFKRGRRGVGGPAECGDVHAGGVREAS